jgi:glycogen debranching enzyme
MSIDTSQNSRQSGSIVVDGISYIPSSVLLTGIPKLSIKDNRAFAVLDPQGEAPRIYSPGSELGIYYNDTRYMGIWELTINGSGMVPLANELRYSGNTVVFSMTNRDLAKIGEDGRISRDTFMFRRIIALVGDEFFETFEIKNFDHQEHILQVEFWSGGRFDDLFEVRGFSRARRGRMLGIEEFREPGQVTTVHQYEGLDDQVRRAYIRRYFDAEKIRVSPSLAGYFTRIRIPPKETVSLRTVISFDREPSGKLHREIYASISVPQMIASLNEHRDKGTLSTLSFESDNAIVNRSLNNALTDIYMLLTREEGEDGSALFYPYAGIPWFSAPFGRDGLITAYQMLPWAPHLGKGVLDYVFRTLGTQIDPFTDEQPGKVFHEMRRGEMAKTREVPFIPYYGSVDSTPLALILLQEYIRWTMDLKSLREWWPQALKALDWIEKWGDFDKDGFLEYAKQSPNGLVNQGWKDSHDSIMYEDGRLAEVPIHLCEVQAYAFRARLAISELAMLMGERELAAQTRSEALQLRARFLEKFWDGEKRIVYLALDGKHRPCSVRSSNMGHCLWSEILPPEQARDICDHLMSDAMFSGYGIRTLADTEKSYNPMSYHNGSIWPHDNSIVMEGLRRYGFVAELERLSTSMISVLESSEDFRLPELFCGFRRRGDAPPIPYEVACKPQAWAAGSLFLMLKSMIGISMDVHQSYVVFNAPTLTNKINWLEIKGLRGRDWEMNVILRRTKTGTVVDVTRRTGTVRVLTVR